MASEVNARPCVVVTGAAGGIGTDLCATLSRQYEVFGVDKSAGDWVSYSADLSQLDSVAGVPVALEAAGLTAVGLVHCAGAQSMGGVGEISDERWLSVLNVNLRSIDLLVSLLLPGLSHASGSVVTIGSVHSQHTARNAMGYAVTKAALAGWVRSAALELAKSGVRVNSVAPGAVMSDMLLDGFKRRAVDGDAGVLVAQLQERTPLGRVGSAEDVAQAVSFLLSKESGFITGAELLVDGGVSICLASEV